MCTLIDALPQRGIDAARAIGGRIVGAGRRVERQVDVVDDVLLVAPLAVDVVGLDRDRGAELALDADRGLPRPRHVDDVERSAELLERARQAGRRAGVAARLPCGEGWPPGSASRRRSSAPARRSAGPAPLVGSSAKLARPSFAYSTLRNLRVAGRKREVGADRVAVVQARAAAEDRTVVQLIREADPRLEVVESSGSPACCQGSHLDVVGEPVQRERPTAGRGSASACRRSSSRPAPTRPTF